MQRQKNWPNCVSITVMWKHSSSRLSVDEILEHAQNTPQPCCQSTKL